MESHKRTRASKQTSDKKTSPALRRQTVLTAAVCVLIVVLVALIAVAIRLTAGQEPAADPNPGTTNAPQDTIQTEPGPATDAPTEPPATALQPTDQTFPEETTSPETEPEETQQIAVQDPNPEPETQATRATSPIKEEIASGTLTCDEFGSYSGQYVEDGRDELVENVAAVRVTNRSDQFLDFATVTIDINGQTATFVVTGLPAGRSAWVLEATKMTIGQTASFEYIDSVTSFRDGVIAQSDDLTVTADGNMLTATNNTGKTMENVFVYYRTVHTDGYFLGGITYRVDIGTLEPGASAEVMAGHYADATSEIVRIGWQDP